MSTGAIPSFDEFKTQQGIPSFEDFKSGAGALQAKAHQDFVDFKSAHPNTPNVEELNTTQAEHPGMDWLKENHPYIHTALGMLKTAEPNPGVMAVEGPLGAAIQTATKAGGESAGAFFSKILGHPKTLAAMKDAAMEFVQEIPGVKTAVKAKQALGTIREVMNDLKAGEVQPPALPIEAPPVGGGTPLRPPLAAKPIAPEAVSIPQELPRWDPSTLPPDPLASDPKMIQAARDLIARRAGAVHPPAAPASLPEADLSTRLADLLRSEKIKGGFDPDRPLGEVAHGKYPARFGGDDSPVIHSEFRKAGSTAKVANPDLLLPKTEFIESLPSNSPLLGKPKALDAAYKLAIELKKTGISSIGDLMQQTGR